MTKTKKLIAALTAITSMVSLGVGTISASAADLDAINEKILNDTASDEEKFIAEYANDSEEMKVADYVINSDISLCDAESLMSSYEIGLANANFAETFSDNGDTVINLNTEFYNDSKATNTVSTKIALDSFDKPTILIMGGLDRGHSFDELNTHLEHVKYVICYGQTKERIKKWCPKECKVVDNLEEATKKAYELSDKGDIILLSPACASWDQFNSFEERGTLYKDIINKL